jgi:DNA-binding CsgD family transcriptional regulator
LNYQSVLPQNIQDMADQTETAHEGKFTFNKKEREILRLFASGNRNKDVAALIRRREKTVRNIISMMYSKAGVYPASVPLLLFAENRRLIPKYWYRELSADCENGLPDGALEYCPQLPSRLSRTTGRSAA